MNDARHDETRMDARIRREERMMGRIIDSTCRMGAVALAVAACGLGCASNVYTKGLRFAGSDPLAMREFDAWDSASKQRALGKLKVNCELTNKKGETLPVGCDNVTPRTNGVEIPTGEYIFRVRALCQPDLESPVEVKFNQGTEPRVTLGLPPVQRRYTNAAVRVGRFPEALDGVGGSVELPPNSVVEIVRQWPDDHDKCTLAIVRVVEAGGAVEAGQLMVATLGGLVDKPVNAPSPSEFRKAQTAAAAAQAAEAAARDQRTEREAVAKKEEELCTQALGRQASVATALARGKQLLKKNEPYFAEVAAKCCLKQQPDHRGCQELSAAAVKRIAAVEPHQIKDVALYQEGRGYQAYFSVVNSAGEYVAVPGRLQIILVFHNYALVRVKELAVFDGKVTVGDFKRTVVGKGGFARPVLVYPRWLSENEMSQALAFNRITGNLTASVEFTFTDLRGRVLTGKDSFHP
jgi:hypothetical protein